MSKKQGSEAAMQPEASPAGKPAKRGDAPGAFMTKLKRFKEYLVLSRAELRKVSWPTWKETRSTTLVVLGFVVVMAILFGLVDMLLSSLARLILS